MSFEAFEPCSACGIEGEGIVCYHHVYTRKAYAELAHVKWNMIPVCLLHHNEFHNKGNEHMAQRYKGVKRWFEDKGWYKDQFLGWFHEK